MLPLTREEHVMDLSYLHHRQQVSVFMSENATCDCSRIVHRKMAIGYAALIAEARHSSALDSLAAAPRLAN